MINIYIYIFVHKRKRKPKRQSRKVNPEKRATSGTQDARRKQAKQKHNTICLEHHSIQANTNNVNKK